MRSLPRKYLVGLIVLIVAIAGAGLVAWRLQVGAQEARWQEAQASFTRADYQATAEHLEGVDVPDDPERLRIYAQTMHATRQFDKALAGYQKLYEVNRDPATLLLIGNVYNEQKRYEDAIRVYREAIAANPANAQSYVNLATAYKMQGNAAEAIRVADDAVKNNPGSVTLHQLRVSMLLDERGSERYEAAVSALRAVSPDDPLIKSLGE